MTVNVAYKWMIKKWEYIVENKGSDKGLYKKYPKLKEFPPVGCAYCELFIKKEKTCNNCPIGMPTPVGYRNFATCHLDNHPYEKWVQAPNTIRAKKMLQFIKDNKPK